MANENIVSMTKVVRFIHNYPPNWIQQAWEGNNHLIQHLDSKWRGYAKHDDSRVAMLKLISDLDTENLFTLMQYIDSLYAEGGSAYKRGGIMEMLNEKVSLQDFFNK